MTDKDMINEFMKNNEVTKCPDAVFKSNNTSRANNHRSFLYEKSVFVKSLKNRNIEKENLLCACGEKISNRTLGGLINKKSKLCFKCQNIKNGRDAQERSAKKVKEQIIVRLGGREDLVDTYRLLRQTKTKNIKNIDVKNLKLFKECIEVLRENKKTHIVESKEIEIDRVLCRKNTEVDWNDWDTPLS